MGTVRLSKEEGYLMAGLALPIMAWGLLGGVFRFPLASAESLSPNTMFVWPVPVAGLFLVS